jgi:hypothetical protein
VVFLAGLVGAEEPKKRNEPTYPIAVQKADKIGVKPGKWNAPTVVTDPKELEAAIPDADTRKRIAGEVDLKAYNLLIFCWQGSGGDKLDTLILESFPEQLKFSLKPGVTDDLRTHTLLVTARKNVKWSTK